MSKGKYINCNCTNDFVQTDVSCWPISTQYMHKQYSIPRPVLIVVGLNAFQTIVSHMLVAINNEIPEPSPYPFCSNSSSSRTMRPATNNYIYKKKKNKQTKFKLWLFLREIQNKVWMSLVYLKKLLTNRKWVWKFVKINKIYKQHNGHGIDCKTH